MMPALPWAQTGGVINPQLIRKFPSPVNQLDETDVAASTVHGPVVIREEQNAGRSN